jgi:hypothetical protein
MHNPYAPPAASPRAPRPTFAPGPPQPWQVGEVFVAAWRAYKANWLPLTGAVFVQTVLGTILQELPGVLVKRAALGHAAEVGAIFIGVVVGFFVQSFFMVGVIRMSLAAARGETVTFSDLFGGASQWLSCFAVVMVSTIGPMIGYAFFLVPGIVLSARLTVVCGYLIDADMTAADALRAS